MISWSQDAKGRHGRTTSYSQVRREIREQSRRTGYGTRSGGYTVGNKKLGLGTAAGFVGGMGYSYPATLATYSIYHRYMWLQKTLHDGGYKSGWDDRYHVQHYER